MSYKSIKVVKGNGGFGGPLVITPSEAKHKFIYITGGGEKPDIVDKIADLTGMEAVNGFKTSIPDEEIALAIVDCGGTLRCGIYPKKGIPTINIVATGKSGPLAQYITEEIYVSAVGLDQISAANEDEKATTVVTEKPTYDTSKKITEQKAETSIVARIGMGAGKVVATFNQAAREAIQTMLNTIIPFIGLCFFTNWGYSGFWCWKLAGKTNGSSSWEHLGTHFDWLYLFLAILISFVGPWSCYQSDYRNLNWSRNRKRKYSASNGSASYICYQHSKWL